MAFFRKIPMICFHGVVPGKYLAVWPVFIVADDPQRLTFKVAVDDETLIDLKGRREDISISDTGTEARRIYLTSIVRQRLHQRGFRERVLRVYNNQCSFCRLRHLELLDAAHIIPDGDPGGGPTGNNGISLCKFHHAAFDRLLLGVRPNCIIEVRKDILKEKDGPMLIHGSQDLHLKKITVPKSSELRPDPDLLDRRYRQFKAVA
jgi:putative restriction endonuclease